MVESTDYDICHHAVDHDCGCLHLDDVETSMDYGIHHQAVDHVDWIGDAELVASVYFGHQPVPVAVAWSVVVEVLEHVGFVAGPAAPNAEVVVIAALD